MKSNFYVFLDIDGVLWDWKFIKQSKIKKGGKIVTFNPESIEAVNYLFDELSFKYNPKLVISSTWRMNMDFTKKVLYGSGLRVREENIFSTDIIPKFKSRELEVAKFLKEVKEKTNYLIIDDDYDFKKYYNENRVIKTNIYDGCLQKSMIDDFLNYLNRSFEEENF